MPEAHITRALPPEMRMDRILQTVRVTVLHITRTLPVMVYMDRRILITAMRRVEHLRITLMEIMHTVAMPRVAHKIILTSSKMVHRRTGHFHRILRIRVPMQIRDLQERNLKQTEKQDELQRQVMQITIGFAKKVLVRHW